MHTLSVAFSDSLWTETFPETVPAINQEGQPEYPGQGLSIIQGRQRSPGPSDSEEGNNDEESLTLIRALAKESPPCPLEILLVQRV